MAAPGAAIFREEDIGLHYDVFWGAKLGEGGGGKVYKARNKHTGKECAVKLMETTPRAALEIELGVQVSRKIPGCVCRVEDAFRNKVFFSDGHSEERFLVVMELCTGDLFDFIQALVGHHMTEDKARVMFRKIVRAVAMLHNFHVVHRDIKPDNILINADGEVKLTDFGWAKVLVSESGNTTMLGTARHMPPELFSGKYGFEVDVFSLGTVLYYMLSGSLPYIDWQMEEKRSNKGLAILDSPSWAGASPSVRDLLKRMLEGDPAKRPTLRSLLEHDPWLAESASFPFAIKHYGAGGRSAFEAANHEARGPDGSPPALGEARAVVGTQSSVPTSEYAPIFS